MEGDARERQISTFFSFLVIELEKLFSISVVAVN